MGYQLNADALNTVFAKWSDTYDIYAPKLFAGTGRSSMQDIVRYGKITKTEEIVWDKRSDYSAKDVLLPVCQTLLYIKENKPKYAIRISTKNFGFENNIKSVPLYATFLI